jgi:hypothetical protein
MMPPITSKIIRDEMKDDNMDQSIVVPYADPVKRLYADALTFHTQYAIRHTLRLRKGVRKSRCGGLGIAI